MSWSLGQRILTLKMQQATLFTFLLHKYVALTAIVQSASGFRKKAIYAQFNGTFYATVVALVTCILVLMLPVPPLPPVLKQMAAKESFSTIEKIIFSLFSSSSSNSVCEISIHARSALVAPKKIS